MFKRKKKKTGCETPEFRSKVPMPPVKPAKPSEILNMIKSSPVAVLPNDISTVEIMCHYETPCGWCCKWDKKCDKKIGCDEPSIPMPDSHARKIIDEIKSGKLPKLDVNDNYGLETRG